MTGFTDMKPRRQVSQAARQGPYFAVSRSIVREITLSRPSEIFLLRTAGPYIWVIRVVPPMSELRPLMLQDRRQSGHRWTSQMCQDRP